MAQLRSTTNPAADPALRADPAQRVDLRLLGDFLLLIDDEPRSLPPAEQRLLAFLACTGHPASRDRVIGELWPDTEPGHAHGRLRSGLWRVRRYGVQAIRSLGRSLYLDPAVSVDLQAGARLARGISDGAIRPPHEALEHLRLLGSDPLPHWFDEWLAPYRDHYHRIRVQALEHAGCALLAAGKPSSAAVLAGEAVAAEPLRDSAHWLLIRALAAEGNHSKAVEHYRDYVAIMRTELGVRVLRSLPDILRTGDEVPVPGHYQRLVSESHEAPRL